MIGWRAWRGGKARNELVFVTFPFPPHQSIQIQILFLKKHNAEAMRSKRKHARPARANVRITYTIPNKPPLLEETANPK
jgi:hypothetical protein